MKRRIGIYSGSFDPIHQGHLAFANEALKACRLDEVIFLPEETPREKPNVATIETRVDLIKQEISKLPQLSVVRLHTSRFTVSKTLPILQNMFPDSDFTLLVGSDIIDTLRHWQNLDVLLGTVSLAIGMREGAKRTDVEAVLGQIGNDHNLTISYTLIYTDHGHLTSSSIRKVSA